MRVRRSLHCFRLRIATIFHHRQIPSQLLEQMDELRGLLLGQKVDLEVQMFPPLLEFGEPFLSDQNYCCREQRQQADKSLEPEKWRRVKLRHIHQSRSDIGEDPQHDK